MARTDPSFNLRLPPDLRSWIEQRAAHNLRSLNGEIAFLIREKRDTETETADASAKSTPTA